MSLAVYVAAPLAEGRTARHIARMLRDAGHTVVSSWHDTHATEDPRHHLERHGIVLLNQSEIRKADALLAWTPKGSTPKETYREIGYAHGRDIPVLWGPEVRETCIGDALCTPIVALDGVVASVAHLERMREAAAPLPVGFAP